MKQQIFIRLAFLLIGFLLPAPLHATAETSGMTYLYHPPESTSDMRYNYHWEILRAALEATADTYGLYNLTPTVWMNEDRQLHEIRKDTGLLTVMIRETTKENEATLIPVRIPIDRNLLGYRVFLIHKKDRGVFAAVNTLDDLRKITMGQGKGWGDVDILESAGFTVVTEIYYDRIFARLMAGNFTGFPRGVTEVLAELEQRRQLMKDMVIEDSLLLYYPLPTYFWFPKNDKGKLLAQRVEDGMNLLINNGEYDKIFQKYYGSLITRLHLKNRKIFRIANPFLPETTPFSDRRLWYDPTR